MLNSDIIDFISASNELMSAIVFPLQANRNAAIHRAYCSSCIIGRPQHQSNDVNRLQLIYTRSSSPIYLIYEVRITCCQQLLMAHLHKPQAVKQVSREIGYVWMHL